MKGVVRNAQFSNKFKRRVHFFARAANSVRGICPRKCKWTWAEGVMTSATKGVPVTDSKFEMLFQGFAGNNTIFIVVLKRQWVIRVGTFKLDFANAGKIFFAAQYNTHKNLFNKK